MVKLILCNEAGGAGRTRETVHSLVVVQSAHLQRETSHTVRQNISTTRHCTHVLNPLQRVQHIQWSVMETYRLSSTFARHGGGGVDAHVPLQGRRQREAFATDVTLEGFVARVGHTVTQQALGVGKGLWAHLQRHTGVRLSSQIIPLDVWQKTVRVVTLSAQGLTCVWFLNIHFVPKSGNFIFVNEDPV